MKHRILFVDDEVNILQSLKRVFRKEKTRIDFVSDSAEAIEKISTEKYSVIVSDMRMPKLNGIDILKAAQKQQPDSVRIVLSGYTDKNHLLEAINEGHIHRFISKPWDEDEFKLSIKDAIHRFEFIQKEKEWTQLLADKNKRLKQLNENLEEMVQARTQEIQMRSETLQLFLEGASAKKVIKKVIKDIKHYLNVKDVELITDKPKKYKSYKVFPIQKKDQYFGCLVIKSKKIPESKIEFIELYIPILALILSIQHVTDNGHELISNIDNLIGTLDDFQE